MDNFKAMAAALAPKMELRGLRQQVGPRKPNWKYIDMIMPIEDKNKKKIGSVTKSIESLRDCITGVASYLEGFDEIAAEDAYRVRFRLNSRIVAILIGTPLHKQEKDGQVFNSSFLFNPLPNKTQIFDIYRLYNRFVNEIAVKFNINDHSPDEISNIATTLNDRFAIDFENVTAENLQDTIRYILNKRLTIIDLLTIVTMAERLRTRKRRKALGIAFGAAVALGAAYFIYQKSRNGNVSNDRKIQENKINDDSESKNTKVLQDKTSEDTLTKEEEEYLDNFEYGEEWLDRGGKSRNMSIEDYDLMKRIQDNGLDGILKDKTSIDQMSDKEWDHLSDFEDDYIIDWLKCRDDLPNMSFIQYVEMRNTEDYGLDDDETDCGDEEPVVIEY